MNRPINPALLSELVDDVAALAASVDGEFQRAQAKAATWEPAPMPEGWRP